MRKKIIKSWFEYLLFKGALSVFRMMPHRWSRKIIVTLFLFVGLVIGIRKRTAQIQIKEAFPQKSKGEVGRIVSEMYKNLALTSLEMFLPCSSGDVESSVSGIEGWENITNALRLNNGLLIISGHIGNWELAGRYIAFRRLPINVVIKKLRNPFFNDFVNHTRNRDGINIIYKSKTMRPIMSALKKNEIVVLLIDQNAGRDGILLPFLNKNASVFTGFARLAERYNTPMMLGVALRENAGKNRFIFEKYQLPSHFAESKDQTISIVRYFNTRLEHYIREYPEQWFWVHRRWKGAEKAKRVSE